MLKNKKYLFLILFIFTLQIYPQSVQNFYELGNFKLENGQTIKNCKIGYRTYGKMNSDKSNIILFPTWFGGNTAGLQSLIGSGKIADSTKYFVITLDALGDGVSSSPSNSKEQPDSKFPQFDIHDMVNSQYQFVTKYFKIKHVFCVMGGSMGGMQTFQWIVAYPNFMDKAVSWVGSPKLTSNDLLLWNAELLAINEGLNCNASEESIMKTVSAFQNLNIVTPQYRVEHTTPAEFPEFLKNMNKGFDKIFNPYNWKSQLLAMIHHDVSKPYNENMQKAASRVKAKLLNIVSLQDHMVNPTAAIAFGKLINAKTIELNNDCGHLGPGCEMGRVNKIVNEFLSEK